MRCGFTKLGLLRERGQNIWEKKSIQNNSSRTQIF